jgi:hypothetical protein
MNNFCIFCGSEQLEFVAKFTYRFDDGSKEVINNYFNCLNCKEMFGIASKGYVRILDCVQDFELKALFGGLD